MIASLRILLSRVTPPSPASVSCLGVVDGATDHDFFVAQLDAWKKANA